MNKNYENTLKEIGKIYDKNRTQMFSILDDLEIKAIKFRDANERRNIKKIGMIQNYEKEMERFYDNFSQSGKLMIKNNSSSE